MNSSSKLVGSSVSSTNEKTEDDLIGGMNKLELLECCHFYCVECTPQNQAKEKHTSCITSTSPSSAFTREISPQQIAEHDGELSQDAGERGNIRGSNRPSRKALHNKSNRNKKKKLKKGPDQLLFFFLHMNKPVVVSLATDATYGDLISRLCTVLGVDGKTNDIHLRTQKSSSEEGEDQSSRGDPALLDAVDSKARLSDLRIPRQKMLILDVEPKKKQGSAEDSKKDQKKNDKDKNGTREDVPSLSQSRAEEPKST
ncbi:hypothetical protein CAEBREN_17863 [Caenorhabditis brenneri]|uniref:Uncharacterized protein n=1 Tax=Caenorhabditis brenneri TaxID=135651 RepID=G0N5J2_CAEBE|nr:hypothetical protein CAEBREN_17863 [Caenorhabditis brenneri]